ncbi:MAG: penicillin-binding protein 2 [Chloroflexi bacterium]|nr:penicillin-binding protein 2 [Chloroflexota bacterium]MQC26515.1 penicillin-binding protein 2 [Chloroflexota bacterium]
MNRELTWRYLMAATVLSVMGLLILWQTFRIQSGPRATTFLNQSEFYSRLLRRIQPPRGQIFDRDGNLLAGNRTVYEIGVELASVEDPRDIAIALSALVGADYNTVLTIASQPASENAIYAVLADYVPPENIELLKAYDVSRPPQPDVSLLCSNDPALESLICTAHLQRSYPEKDLASSVLGFVSREGIGYFGVEQQYQDLLAGLSETVWVPTDPSRAEEMPEIPAGASLVLTLDRDIQAAVEDILDTNLEQTGAESGTILVMHATTGEILAMASSPRLDLNEFWKYPEIFPDSTPFNRAISQTYEPGSVFKIVTMAAALDKNVVKPDTPFMDTGYIEIGGIGIRNWNGQAWGQQNMLTCLQYSLNVCLAWVGQELGADAFYDYVQEFGFGYTTGIDLAGEARGNVKEPGDQDWYPADLGTNTFGQGIAVTPVQMVMAVSALTNNGQMVIPHIVKSLVQDGSQYNISPQYAGAPITAQTAKTLSEMLAVSLEQEASNALVPGYRVAGKTGTAQIPGPNGYLNNQTNTSFVGWGPVDSPQFIVYVWIEKPSTSIWASDIAAPIFSEVVERLVVLMNIPPDALRLELAAAGAN